MTLFYELFEFIVRSQHFFRLCLAIIPRKNPLCTRNNCLEVAQNLHCGQDGELIAISRYYYLQVIAVCGNETINYGICR